MRVESEVFLAIVRGFHESSGEVVHDHVDKVLLVNLFGKHLSLLVGELLLTYNFAGNFFVHFNLVRRVLNNVSGQDLSKVLSTINDSLLRSAKRQIIKVIRQLRPAARHFVNLELHSFACLVLSRCNTRQVKSLGARRQSKGTSGHQASRDRPHRLRLPSSSPSPATVFLGRTLLDRSTAAACQIAIILRPRAIRFRSPRHQS
mmetsp:Transcript_22218/g.39387  ORF Transcript_22218/g.39387 Transcript_22218/m.39387 type:complete len:203 (-) Transcript_22218:150-758(-)